MGGLLAADTLREFLKGRDTQQDFVLWPNIKAIIAFDTPVRNPNSSTDRHI